MMAGDYRPATPEPNFQVLRLQNQGGKSSFQVRRYQKRKSHSKSKEGCSSCKAHRVKCDENKPICKRCDRNRWPCSYNSSVASHSANCIPGPQVNILSNAQSQLSHLPTSLGMNQSSLGLGTPKWILFQHFQKAHQEIFGSPAPSPVVDLGIARPYVLDAILAVTASHLRHHTAHRSMHRVAELNQKALALRSFQTALNSPLDQKSSDALLFAAMMLNLLSFSSVDDDNAHSSWVFSDERDRFGWFSLQLGYKPLLMATRQFRKDSILQWMFAASNEDRMFWGEGHPLDRVPEAWLVLCGLRDQPSPENIFYEPVRILAEIRRLPPDPTNFFLYVSFIGKLDKEFRTLLELHDERAFWLLGYWFGLLCRYDFWWLRKQAWRDYRAIQLWLNERLARAQASSSGLLLADLKTDLEQACRWSG
ncbi:hypothetical protein F4779DRAFT_330785 [Xylariaceae sp. FL0662B]|nr:hypothetical protein F4779DRAFT_330785 [Xylariaceae sp. FL0662B]